MPRTHHHLAAVAALALAVFPSSSGAAPEAPKLLEPEKTILFLGDSITQAGTYVAYIQTYLWRRYPERNYRLINLGLSSETASGLTEPDHPYPRPCIHSRLDRALAQTAPDLTFICYGMNDGIYHPPSEQRLAAYRDGITKLIKKVRAVGSKVVLLTPPPFDAESRRLRGKELASADAPEFGYKTPFENYDAVLEEFGAWVMEPRESVELAIDVHTPIEKDITSRRAADPDYQYGDGVHPNAAGHDIFARTILAALEAPGLDDLPDLSAPPQGSALAAAMPLILERHKMLSAAWREHVGHDRPGKAKALPLAEAQARAAALE
ncbi:MAG: SGNH/GDSL hydrolase family protein, partial [Verrucomicrobiales bacterium]